MRVVIEVSTIEDINGNAYPELLIRKFVVETNKSDNEFLEGSLEALALEIQSTIDCRFATGETHSYCLDKEIYPC
jgi:hypothetical protein